MTSCRSILFALCLLFYRSYCLSQSIETTQLPTNQSAKLNLLNMYGECHNPADATFREDYISLSACLDLCENDDCIMLQYYDKLHSDSDSRCYIFDQICDLSQNVGERTNYSHIYYKNQFTTNYCVNYRDWNDKYMDSCDAYVSHGLCLNGNMTEKATTEIFEQAADLIYNWNALETCCECGGGKHVFNNIAVTYMNKNHLNSELDECSFKTDMQNTPTINLVKWNNFGLHQLIEGMNYPLNSDLFIYKHLSNVNSTILNSSALYICNFAAYDISSTSHDIYTDFFMFASVENIEEEEYTYLINSEYFDIDLSVISSVLEVGYYTYQECNNFIVNASLDDSTDMDMILPCFAIENYHQTSSTDVPTQTNIEKVTEVTEFTEEISPTTKPENNWVSVILPCVAVLIVLVFIALCIFYLRKKKKPEPQKLEKHQALSENDVPTVINDMIINENLDENDDVHITIPTETIDDDCKYGTDEKEEIIEHKKNGLLVYQEEYYTKEQMKNIFDQNYANDKSSGSTLLPQAPKLLFGDNDIDNQREEDVKRLYSDGQAEIMGKFDKSIAFGIITAFYKLQPPEIDEFKKLMDGLFSVLLSHLLNGNDVVVPKPTKNDLLKNQHRYCINDKQIIFHNLGTGIAELPFTHLQYIQNKIDKLGEYARDIQTVKYYSYCPTEQIENADHSKTIYECSWCRDKVHYLMKLKYCEHDCCERCLANDIVKKHLDYANYSEDDRFRCWVTKTGKCPNGVICLEDVKIPDDKCYCDHCKQKNRNNNNGTILDDESYRQFKHIMDAFSETSPHYVDHCPNLTCKKPFQIDRAWRNKDEKVTKAHYYQRKISFFEDIVVDQNQCNCCGKKINNANLENMSDDLEIGTVKNQTVNNCRICHEYYCDACRLHCFYEIEREYIMRPPTPVNEAIMKFHKLKKTKMKNEESEQKSEMKKETFECCEICWYKFYCRQCPHCQHRFCGMCYGKWNGCTENWTDKLQNVHPENDEEKYGADNLHTYVDEKNGKHDSKGHHMCDEKLILQKETAQLNMKNEEMVNKKIKLMEDKLKDEHNRNIQNNLKYRNIQKQLEISENENNQQRLATAEKDAKIKELENQMLKLEKKELKDQLLTTENEKKDAEKKQEEYKSVAAEERKQKDDKQKELEKFQKNVWRWKDHEKWTSYDEDINKKIEGLKIGESFPFLMSENNKQKNYKITRTSECKGTQENTETTFTRHIERFVVTASQEYIQYPPFWNKQFDVVYAEPKLVQLDINQSPAKEVANAFYLTSKFHYKYKCNVKIISIEFVQNKRLFDIYWSKRNVLKKEIGESKLNEKDLWHGTRAENVLDLIKKEGFRREFNKTSAWGEGTYFAVNAGYSVDYTSNNNGVHKMFQTKVLCGESCLGNHGYKLTSWPKKKNKLIYDSLHSKGNDIYVIHDDGRVYPMFVVTFTLLK